MANRPNRHLTNVGWEQKQQPFDVVRDRLLLETQAQGLRAVDLCELTGWPQSRVSKIMTKKQKINHDDCEIWARALGFRVYAFYQDEENLATYKAKNPCKSPAELVRTYYSTRSAAAEDEEMDARAARGDIFEFELPLSILESLGLKASDYAIRIEGDPWVGWIGRKDEIAGIRFWHRGTHKQNRAVPEFGIWFDSKRENYAIVAYIHDDSGNDEPFSFEEPDGTIRWSVGGPCRVNNMDLDELPDYVRKNMFFHATLGLSEFDNTKENDDTIVGDLRKAYKEYCTAVLKVTRMDLLEDARRFAAFTGRVGPISLGTILGPAPNSSDWQQIVRTVREKNENRCEIDENHQSFIDKNGNTFMVVIPLIPITLDNEDEKDVRIEANAVCLCPTCAYQFREGRNDDREDMMMKLLRKHKAALEKEGIRITLSELLQKYRL